MTNSSTHTSYDRVTIYERDADGDISTKITVSPETGEGQFFGVNVVVDFEDDVLWLSPDLARELGKALLITVCGASALERFHETAEAAPVAANTPDLDDETWEGLEPFDILEEYSDHPVDGFRRYFEEEEEQDLLAEVEAEEPNDPMNEFVAIYNQMKEMPLLEKIDHYFDVEPFNITEEDEETLRIIAEIIFDSIFEDEQVEYLSVEHLRVVRQFIIDWLDEQPAKHGTPEYQRIQDTIDDALDALGHINNLIEYEEMPFTSDTIETAYREMVEIMPLYYSDTETLFSLVVRQHETPTDVEDRYQPLIALEVFIDRLENLLKGYLDAVLIDDVVGWLRIMETRNKLVAHLLTISESHMNEEDLEATHRFLAITSRIPYLIEIFENEQEDR